MKNHFKIAFQWGEGGGGVERLSVGGGQLGIGEITSFFGVVLYIMNILLNE